MDIPQYAGMTTATGRKLKRLMATVSTLAPFKPNMAQLGSKLGISRLRFYLTANNVFSKARNHLIQDYDAERGGEATAPLQRQFIFGINLDF